MDPLSIFINLLAKTDGRDKVLSFFISVSTSHSIRNPKFENSKWSFFCSIRPNQNDQKSFAIFKNLVILNQNTSVSP